MPKAAAIKDPNADPGIELPPTDKFRDEPVPVDLSASYESYDDADFDLQDPPGVGEVMLEKTRKSVVRYPLASLAISTSVGVGLGILLKRLR